MKVSKALAKSAAIIEWEYTMGVKDDRAVVYRSQSDGRLPWVRLGGGEPISETKFEDRSLQNGNYNYMVRKARLEVGPGGSYWNLSAGEVRSVRISNAGSALLASIKTDPLIVYQDFAPKSWPLDPEPLAKNPSIFPLKELVEAQICQPTQLNLQFGGEGFISHQLKNYRLLENFPKYLENEPKSAQLDVEFFDSSGKAFTDFSGEHGLGRVNPPYQWWTTDERRVETLPFYIPPATPPGVYTIFASLHADELDPSTGKKPWFYLPLENPDNLKNVNNRYQVGTLKVLPENWVGIDPTLTSVFLTPISGTPGVTVSVVLTSRPGADLSNNAELLVDGVSKGVMTVTDAVKTENDCFQNQSLVATLDDLSSGTHRFSVRVAGSESTVMPRSHVRPKLPQLELSENLKVQLGVESTLNIKISGGVTLQPDKNSTNPLTITLKIPSKVSGLANVKGDPNPLILPQETSGSDPLFIPVRFTIPKEWSPGDYGANIFISGYHQPLTAEGVVTNPSGVSYKVATITVTNVAVAPVVSLYINGKSMRSGDRLTLGAGSLANISWAAAGASPSCTGEGFSPWSTSGGSSQKTSVGQQQILIPQIRVETSVRLKCQNSAGTSEVTVILQPNQVMESQTH